MPGSPPQRDAPAGTPCRYYIAQAVAGIGEAQAELTLSARIAVSVIGQHGLEVATGEAEPFGVRKLHDKGARQLIATVHQRPRSAHRLGEPLLPRGALGHVPVDEADDAGQGGDLVLLDADLAVGFEVGNDRGAEAGDVVGGAEARILRRMAASEGALCWPAGAGVAASSMALSAMMAGDDAASRRRWQGGCVWGGLALPAPRGLHLQAVESCPQHMKKGRLFSGPVDGG